MTSNSNYQNVAFEKKESTSSVETSPILKKKPTIEYEKLNKAIKVISKYLDKGI